RNVWWTNLHFSRPPSALVANEERSADAPAPAQVWDADLLDSRKKIVGTRDLHELILVFEINPDLPQARGVDPRCDGDLGHLAERGQCIKVATREMFAIIEQDL